MRSERFRNFAAIDWSGAVGERHRGIAVALLAEGATAPVLVRPDRRWSRSEVLGWLLEDLPADTLVGMDFGMALPFADCGAFFPQVELDDSPPDARALWSFVDFICGFNNHLGVSDFVNHPHFCGYFRHFGRGEGAMFRCDGATHGRGRFRVTERAQETMGCKPYSNFNLVGAAQVGKSSLSGMRLLHRLERRLPVWPVDPHPESGSVVVEIYTTIAALAAGRRAARSKIRDHGELNAALLALGSGPIPGQGPISDHASDALITAAWLRTAAHDRNLWNPSGLTSEIARTEGWTFGVR